MDARHIFPQRETRQVSQNHSAQPLHQSLSQRRHPLQHKVRLDVHLKSVLFAQTVQMALAWELKQDFLETFFFGARVSCWQFGRRALLEVSNNS